MQQPGIQTSMGGHGCWMGGPGTTAPPLATPCRHHTMYACTE